MIRFSRVAALPPLLLSSGLIILSTGALLPCRVFLDRSHFALLYLPVILLAAGAGGVSAGLMTASLAFLCWDFFFIPPYYTLAVADPEDWISLAVFLLVGLTAGMLTGRLREREEYALARQRETSLLYRLSENLVAETSLAEVARVLLWESTEITGAGRGSLLIEDEARQLHSLAHVPAEVGEPAPLFVVTRWVLDSARALGAPAVADLRERPSRGWPLSLSAAEAPLSSLPGLYIPLQTGVELRGVLYLGSLPDGSGAIEEDFLLSIAHLAASHIERESLLSAASTAMALREGDRLKTTLLSSVSHELKTPLAAVTAAVTGLLERDVHLEPELVRAELEAASDGLDRLNVSIGALLELTRLEAGAWAPRMEPHDLGEVLGTVLAKLPPREVRRIQLEVPEELPPVPLDYLQMTSAILHLVENALCYGGAQELVRIGITCRDQAVRLWVEDRGPGIPSVERERIFEKFFRGKASVQAPAGVGLGLTIAREIAGFHHARLWVEDAAPAGTRFVLEIPLPETTEHPVLNDTTQNLDVIPENSSVS